MIRRDGWWLGSRAAVIKLIHGQRQLHSNHKVLQGCSSLTREYFGGRVNIPDGGLRQTPIVTPRVRRRILSPPGIWTWPSSHRYHLMPKLQNYTHKKCFEGTECLSHPELLKVMWEFCGKFHNYRAFLLAVCLELVK